ncbi:MULTISPECIES: aldehyde dehydrogenase family protein [unclassified Imperialibacter]|uniref:aldehyde dehydrogenase family protein n=1 Tax=unclassified Imperialibacter TaxID=2629706 RepID=UPI001254B9F1|nr:MULTISPECIES: aldehyde dehydrogenase family protein [unclassified Imperialibacter]CAD5267673.1 Aldehyde dehydrogenase [Imperialibacter sp. 89]CAD5296111.1 Aldehyde dehydrogenase [Imperialibacter sp. 75]VVT33737.1 Aldehyde dehydrogenase [Imperialibacter sp. EC-SDR9]
MIDEKHQTKTLDFDLSEVFLQQSQKALLLRKESYKLRIDRLKKIKAWILANKARIRDAVYSDFKKPGFEADLSETFVVLADINLALKSLKKWTRPTSLPAGLTYFGSSASVVYEPKGVCLIISPWNYPFNLCIGPLVSAIAAGNTAILKPSELTPNTSKLIAKMVGELFPQGEVAVYQGGPEVTQQLLRLPFNHIFFTGSSAVGKIVMEAAAKNLSSVTLELGGKSPVVIDKTADLKDAAEKIVWGKLLNCGQTCVSPDYLFIHESVKEPFLEHLKYFLETLFKQPGEDFKESPSYARIINKKHYQRLCQALSTAIEDGASLIYGGDVDETENFISPTVLDNVPLHTTLMREEIFGPILPVNTFKNHDEVIQYINGQPKALSLYLFSNDKGIQKRYRLETSSGTACVNDVVVQFQQPHLPFGGVNESGIGKSHGHFGFLAFSNEKAWLKQRVGFTSAKLLYPPYTAAKKRILNILMKYF